MGYLCPFRSSQRPGDLPDRLPLFPRNKAILSRGCECLLCPISLPFITSCASHIGIDHSLKEWANAQLDIIFALAHEEGKNPVWISQSGEIPEAGSPEAEAILGRTPARPNMSEKGQKKHSFGASRIISREGRDKRNATHAENV